MLPAWFAIPKLVIGSLPEDRFKSSYSPATRSLRFRLCWEKEEEEGRICVATRMELSKLITWSFYLLVAPWVHPRPRVQPAAVARGGGGALVPAARLSRLADHRHLLHHEHRRHALLRRVQVCVRAKQICESCKWPIISNASVPSPHLWCCLEEAKRLINISWIYALLMHGY